MTTEPKKKSSPLVIIGGVVLISIMCLIACLVTALIFTPGAKATPTARARATETKKPASIPSATSTLEPTSTATLTPEPMPTATPIPMETSTLDRTVPLPTISPSESSDKTIASLIEIVCLPYGVTNVEIADGRSAGGERIAIVTLETDAAEVFSELGAIFGATYEASTGEIQGDLDSILIVIGNKDGMATAMVSAKMSDVGAWITGRITVEQFFGTWTITDF